MDLYKQQLRAYSGHYACVHNTFFPIQELLTFTSKKSRSSMFSEIQRVCTSCKKTKDQFLDFYICKGSIRGACKACTIKKNAKYQKDRRMWLYRDTNNDEAKKYRREYYANNRQKFAAYREKHRLENPGYNRAYYLRKKDKKTPVETSEAA